MARLTFIVRQKIEDMTKALTTVLLCLLLIDVLIVIPFAWVLRDGLGPDAVDSSGFEALQRCFMTFYSGPLLFALLICLGVAVVLRGSKRLRPSVK